MITRIALLERRKALGFTQGQVAEKAKISRPYYTNIEKGRKAPSMDVAKCIADALQTSIEKFFLISNVPKRNSA